MRADVAAITDGSVALGIGPQGMIAAQPRHGGIVPFVKRVSLDELHLATRFHGGAHATVREALDAALVVGRDDESVTGGLLGRVRLAPH